MKEEVGEGEITPRTILFQRSRCIRGSINQVTIKAEGTTFQSGNITWSLTDGERSVQLSGGEIQMVLPPCSSVPSYIGRKSGKKKKMFFLEIIMVHVSCFLQSGMEGTEESYDNIFTLSIVFPISFCFSLSAKLFVLVGPLDACNELCHFL